MEEYTLELLRHLFELDTENHYVLFLNSFSESKADLGELEQYPNVTVKKFRWPNKILNFCFWYFGWPKIDQLLGGVDILFFPNLNFAAWSRKTKAILTIHDLSFEQYPETFSWKRRLWHFFINPKQMAQRANKVIAVSQSTRHDLEQYYKIHPPKTETIWSAAGEKFRVLDRNDIKMIAVKEKYRLPYKFILSLGTFEPRKNLVAVIRAYSHLRALKNPELDKYQLVLAGNPGWKSREIFREIENSEVKKDILVLQSVAEVHKPYLFSLASLFVYPSLFEGFGFPPLEAMQSGVPVITSNNSSLPEIVGEAGIMIDPDKPEELFRAMKEILEKKELQEKLRARGIVQAQKFNWDKSAREFLEVIRTVAKK